MFGPLLLALFSLLALVAGLLPRSLGRRLLARTAVRFSALSDGGLDDDFAEAAYQLVRKDPRLLDALEIDRLGSGWPAHRRRLTVEGLRRAHELGARSLF